MLHFRDMKQSISFAAAVMAAALASSEPLFAQTPASAPNPADFYQRSCASCHDGGADRAPNRDALRAMTPERVLRALEAGPMIAMAVGRSAAERRAIAEFLTDKKFNSPLSTAPRAEAMCSAPAGAGDKAAFDPSSGPKWNGWGVTTTNTRFQDAAMAGLSAADVPRLKLKWAFGFPGDLQSNAQSTIAGGRVFVGSAGGIVYSLSAATGCVHWFFETGAPTRAAISVARIKTPAGMRYAALFGDGAANAYAVDAETGKLLWKTKVETSPVARITGSPTFYEGRYYVPMASSEEGAGTTPTYECCKFRGSVTALDASTGKIIWQTYTIPEVPFQTTKNKIGTRLWGPSGAPVWSSPAIDPRRPRPASRSGPRPKRSARDSSSGGSTSSPDAAD